MIEREDSYIAGTIQGGVAAAKTNKVLYGEDFYQVIGKKGGHKGTTGGFFGNRELAMRAGAIGGAKSRRGPTRLTEEQKVELAEIRQKLSENVPVRVIARIYGRSESNIYNIHWGKIYRATFVDSCLCAVCEMKRGIDK